MHTRPTEQPLGRRLDRRAEACSAGTNHQDIVRVGLEAVHRGLGICVARQNNRGSLIVPEATSRTYRSALQTVMKLIQANSMCRSFRKLAPRHAECRVRVVALHEKQSSFPPTRCRAEWHEKL